MDGTPQLGEWNMRLSCSKPSGQIHSVLLSEQTLPNRHRSEFSHENGGSKTCTVIFHLNRWSENHLLVVKTWKRGILKKGPFHRELVIAFFLWLLSLNRLWWMIWMKNSFVLPSCRQSIREDGQIWSFSWSNGKTAIHQENMAKSSITLKNARYARKMLFHHMQPKSSTLLHEEYFPFLSLEVTNWAQKLGKTATCV